MREENVQNAGVLKTEESKLSVHKQELYGDNFLFGVNRVLMGISSGKQKFTLLFIRKSCALTWVVFDSWISVYNYEESHLIHLFFLLQ